jgi:thioredoxin 1
MIEVNSDNFEEILNSPDIVALYFYGDWCTPCKQMLPILKKVNKNIDNITFYKVNIDTNKDIVQTYNIKSIPTVVLIKNGKEVSRFAGSMSEEDVKNKLKEI